MTTPGSALVLGGTGHVGHALLRELLLRGYRVRALSRQRRPSLLAGLAVEVVQGDADAPGILERWMEGMDVVVDAAAPYPLYLPAPECGAADPVRAAVWRTARLAEAVRRRGAALLFISSFTTLPWPHDSVSMTEARLRRAAHPYFEAKQAMEAVVLDEARRGLRAVIVNPTACLGPWDQKPRSLCYLPLLLSGELPATLMRTVNVVDVRDVARGAVAALSAGLFGQPFLLAGHDVRADELSARACALLGRRPPRFRVSARATATAAWWMEWGFTTLGLRAPLPSLPALLLCEARGTGLSRAQWALGALPRPIEQTLRDSIDWYRWLGYLRPRSLGH